MPAGDGGGQDDAQQAQHQAEDQGRHRAHQVGHHRHHAAGQERHQRAQQDEQGQAAGQDFQVGSLHPRSGEGKR
ncbi:hypothetical protein MY55_20445 [Chromobacterium subtsugae]|nr:hypothetical protein MY55_20445 [Chromobacterium subtsugae]